MKSDSPNKIINAADIVSVYDDLEIGDTVIGDDGYRGVVEHKSQSLDARPMPKDSFTLSGSRLEEALKRGEIRLSQSGIQPKR